MAQTVVGFFDDASEARRAVEQLTQQGISRDSIDVKENTGTGNVSASHDSDDNGVTRFFKSLFGDNDQDADRYSRVAGSSRCIVTVHSRSNDEAERAADILDDFGAIDVDERASSYAASSAGSDYDRTENRDYDRTENLDYNRTENRDYDRTENRTNDRNERETIIPRVEENLEVGKRTEERGGVRVRSRIVERPVEEHIRLREEHVHVERQAVDRPLSGDERNAFQDRDIELTERSEVPVVNKEARVVEEVKISKEVNERDEVVRDTVRNTEIDIDKLDERRSGLRDDQRP
jgi:stress response protein YsnF